MVHYVGKHLPCEILNGAHQCSHTTAVGRASLVQKCSLGYAFHALVDFKFNVHGFVRNCSCCPVQQFSGMWLPALPGQFSY